MHQNASGAARRYIYYVYLRHFKAYKKSVLQVHAVLHQKHPVTRLFLASVVLEMIAMLFEVIHGAKYAVDGVGVTDVAVAGDILDILSRVKNPT